MAYVAVDELSTMSRKHLCSHRALGCKIAPKHQEKLSAGVHQTDTRIKGHDWLPDGGAPSSVLCIMYNLSDQRLHARTFADASVLQSRSDVLGSSH